MLFLQMAMVAPPPPAQQGGRLNIKDMIKNVAQQVNSGGATQAPQEAAMMVHYKKQAIKLKKEIQEDGERFMEAMERDHELMEAVLNEDPMVLARWLKKKVQEWSSIGRRSQKKANRIGEALHRAVKGSVQSRVPEATGDPHKQKEHRKQLRTCARVHA